MSQSANDDHKSTNNNENFTVKKLPGHFVDEIANVSISPNGACRLQFATWETNEDGSPHRVDSEIIMTHATLVRMADALPKAIEQAKTIMNKSSASSKPTALN